MGSTTGPNDPYPENHHDPSSGPVRRRRIGLIVAATAVALAAVGIGGILGLRSREPGSASDVPRLEDDNRDEAKPVVADPSTTTAAEPTDPPTTTTEAPPPFSLRDVDFHNRIYDIDCGYMEYRPTEVRDGSWTAAEGPEYGSVNLLDVHFGDATGDGEENALVQLHCTIGMSGAISGTDTYVFGVTDGKLHQIGQPIPDRVEIIDGELIGETPYYEPDDSFCCPSSLDRTTWILIHGGWAKDQVQRLPYDS